MHFLIKKTVAYEFKFQYNLFIKMESEQASIGPYDGLVSNREAPLAESMMA